MLAKCSLYVLHYKPLFTETTLCTYCPPPSLYRSCHPEYSSNYQWYLKLNPSCCTDLHQFPKGPRDDGSLDNVS